MKELKVISGIQNTLLPQLKSLKAEALQKTTYFKHRNFYQKIISARQCNSRIAELIQGKEPVMISRFGSSELACVTQYLKGAYQESAIVGMRRAAGFFPTSKDALDRYCEMFLEAIKPIDMLGVWLLQGEAEIAQKFSDKLPTIVNLIDLEPYFHEDPWSQYLSGKKVLVIHPFAETILENYYQRREHLFDDPAVLPVFDLMAVQAVQSRGDYTGGFSSWFEAYDWLCEQVRMKEFDIAIIGCGSYGLPLAGFIKSLSKKAIHLGGATQILFGIRGHRWDARPRYQALYNSSWVRPSTKETLPGLENGWYW